MHWRRTGSGDAGWFSVTGNSVRRGAVTAMAFSVSNSVLFQERVFFVFFLGYFGRVHGTLAMAAAARWTVSARRCRAPASWPMRSKMLAANLGRPGGGEWRGISSRIALAVSAAARCGRGGLVAASGLAGCGGDWSGQALGCAVDSSGCRGDGAGARLWTISCWVSWKNE